MTGELRIGLVGGGRLAELGYLPALHAAHGVRLAAVAEVDPGRRGRMAGLSGVPAHRDAAALLAAGNVDALVIATPAGAHLADARPRRPGCRLWSRSHRPPISPRRGSWPG